MLETSRICDLAGAVARGPCKTLAWLLVAVGCAAPAPVVVEKPAPPAVVMPAPVAVAPAPDEGLRLAEEAKAMLAQAETDVNRARARRALWLKAWEDLLLARQASGANDPAKTVRHAKRASELAQLGLEQLAYPATRMNTDPGGQK